MGPKSAWARALAQRRASSCRLKAAMSSKAGLGRLIWATAAATCERVEEPAGWSLATSRLAADDHSIPARLPRAAKIRVGGVGCTDPRRRLDQRAKKPG